MTLSEELLALGVAPGGVLLAHISFRAVRPVENGPTGLVSALREALGPDGTLVMPSWGADDDTPFDPRSTPAAPDLGVTAELLPTLVEDAFADPLMITTPRRPEAQDVLRIYETCMSW